VELLSVPCKIAGELLSVETFVRDSRKTVATVVGNDCKVYKDNVYLILLVFDTSTHPLILLFVL